MKKAISYTFIFLGIQLLVAGIAHVIMELTGHQEWATQAYPNIIITLTASLLTLIVFLVQHWTPVSGAYLQTRPWAVVAWSVLTAIGVVIPSIFFQEFIPELPNLNEDILTEFMTATGGYFAICLTAPFVEELVMRGAVLRSLLEWMPQRRWAMIALSALLFAIVHINPAQMPHAFLMGLLLGWMYERTGSIVPGIAFHWANNTIAYFLVRLYPNPDLRLADILGSEQHVWMAVGFSLMIFLPSVYQLFLRMKRP